MVHAHQNYIGHLHHQSVEQSQGGVIPGILLITSLTTDFAGKKLSHLKNSQSEKQKALALATARQQEIESMKEVSNMESQVISIYINIYILNINIFIDITKRDNG